MCGQNCYELEIWLESLNQLLLVPEADRVFVIRWMVTNLLKNGQDTIASQGVLDFLEHGVNLSVR